MAIIVYNNENDTAVRISCTTDEFREAYAEENGTNYFDDGIIVIENRHIESMKLGEYF